MTRRSRNHCIAFVGGFLSSLGGLFSPPVLVMYWFSGTWNSGGPNTARLFCIAGMMSRYNADSCVARHTHDVVYPEVHPPSRHAGHAHFLPVHAFFQYVCRVCAWDCFWPGVGRPKCLLMISVDQVRRPCPRAKSSGLTPPRALVSSPPLPVAWKSLSISQCTTRARSQLRVCLCVCV